MGEGLLLTEAQMTSDTKPLHLNESQVKGGFCQGGRGGARAARKEPYNEMNTSTHGTGVQRGQLEQGKLGLVGGKVGMDLMFAGRAEGPPGDSPI